MRVNTRIGAGLKSVAVALAISAGVCIGASNAADFTMRINHTFGVNSFPDRALQEFKKQVEQKSNKQIEVKLYSAGELGQEIEQYDLMQAGSLEAALLGGQILGSVAPEYGMFEAPYLWRDQAHLRKVWDGAIGKEISDVLLQRKGIRIIGAWNRGARNLTTSTKVVKTVADLQGLKIRTTQNPVHVAAWKALGAVPTPLPFGEVFMALKTGVMDGQENPLDLIQSASLFEVQKNLMLTEHVRSIGWFGVSEVWFKRLPDNLKKLVLDEATAAMKLNDGMLAAEETKIRGELAKRMNIVPGSDIDLAAFRERLKGLPQEFAKTWKKGLYEQIVDTK
jgi:tripartite ATP-independent transporter DctP family solute receptor